MKLGVEGKTRRVETVGQIRLANMGVVRRRSLCH